ncbi:MAG: alpha/beta fold hydrolase [Candidatus Hydrogenedentota bacterium]
MLGLLIVLLVVTAIAVASLLYWNTLVSLYPEPLRCEEITTITTGDLWKLRLCRYRKGRNVGEPILFVHGAGANHHNFTCPEGESLVDFLMQKGYDCWAIDLRGTRSSRPPFGHNHFDVSLEDHLDEDLPSVIAHIRRVTGYDRLHWAGHSMGGMLLYAYALAHGEEQIAAGITIASPPGFENVTLPPVERPLALLRRMPYFGCACIRALLPIQLRLRITSPLLPVNLANLHPDITIRHFFNMMDNVQPGVMGELVAAAREGGWHMRNGALDMQAGLTRLHVPLLAFFAMHDPFVPLAEARTFFERLPSDDKRAIYLGKSEGASADYAHIEIPFARESHREVFQPILAWLRAHPITPGEPASTKPEQERYSPPPSHQQRKDILSGSSFQHVVKNSDEAPPPEPPSPEANGREDQSPPA